MADAKFLSFLKKNGLKVKDQMVPVDQAHLVPKLYEAWLRDESKVSGLPKSLAEHAGKTLQFGVSGAPRDGQDPKEYKVRLVDSSKNHDKDDTWDGTLEGTVANLWQCLNADDYGIHPGDIEEELLYAVENED